MSDAGDRPDGTRHSPGGGTGRVVTTCAQSGSSLFAFEVTEPPGGGPPLHVHTREDEFFYVLEGEVSLWLDGKVSTAGAGSGVFLPRGVPHTFKNCSDARLRMLIVCTPGGIEPFFDYGASLPGGAPPTDEALIERIAALAPQFGITILGPSPL